MPGIITSHYCDQMPDWKSWRKGRFIFAHYCRGFGCASSAPCTQTEFHSNEWDKQKPHGHQRQDTAKDLAQVTISSRGRCTTNESCQNHVRPEVLVIMWQSRQISIEFLPCFSSNLFQWLPKWHVQKSYCIWLCSVNFKGILVCVYSLRFCLYNILYFKHRIDNSSTYKVNKSKESSRYIVDID